MIINKKIMITVFAIQLIMVVLVLPCASYEQTIGSDESDYNHDKIIEKGLRFLHESQLPSGGFASYMSDSPNTSEGTYEFTLFDTGFVLHTLSLLDRKSEKKFVKEMKTKGIAFLLNDTESPGVWRFWGKDEMALPPDMDTTSTVFAALIESDVNLNDETLDYMLEYRAPNGAFYTWMNSDEWLDPSNPLYYYFKENVIDANVNANVLYAYSLRHRTDEGIINYLNDVATTKSFLEGTTYYPSPLAFCYLLTRDYSDGGVKELKPSIANIKEYILENQKSDGGWGNDLHTAFATVSLINMGYRGKQLEKAIEHILDTQEIDGSWESYAYYMGQPDPSSPLVVYHGSRELSTSFSLEALIKYNKIVEYGCD